jgi:hypothetical protein
MIYNELALVQAGDSCASVHAAAAPAKGLRQAPLVLDFAMPGQGARGRSCVRRYDSFTVDGSRISLYIGAFLPRAQMAELVDALRSGRSSRKGVEVRVLFWAPVEFI